MAVWGRQEVESGARCLGPVAMAFWGRQQGGSGARCLGPVAMAFWGRRQGGSGPRCWGISAVIGWRESDSKLDQAPAVWGSVLARTGWRGSDIKLDQAPGVLEDQRYNGEHICFPSLPPMLECGFESRLGLEFSGFSMWQFLRLVVRGFLRALR